jgi:hypothetical protein
MLGSSSVLFTAANELAQFGSLIELSSLVTESYRLPEEKVNLPSHGKSDRVVAKEERF